MLPPSAIVPDPDNRRMLDDEDFASLCDSIRVSGILQPLQVWRRPDGTHRLIDGERRWRAAQTLGVNEVPCDVWPSDADPRRVAVAGLALNEHRKAHGCLNVARRLRDIKNETGLTHADLAAHSGLPLDRVKSYFSLFDGSDGMLTFLERHGVPLKVAAELVRYERATNEARGRRLVQRYLESPLTAREILALRKRETSREPSKSEPSPERKTMEGKRIFERFESVVRRDPSALAQLEDLARRLGFQLVPTAARAGS
jgi:ParB family chromosome partitioning protein